MNTKYVKVWADRDRYRQKILDAKEDIARFNVLVEEKAYKKAETFIQELNNLKKSLISRIENKIILIINYLLI